MKYLLIIGGILFLGVTILALNTPNQEIVIIEEPQEKENPHLNAFISDCERYFDFQFNQAHTPGAAILIVKDTNVLLMKGMGVRSIETKESVDTKTVFRLASLSKGMSAVLMGMLVMDGELAWNDKVLKYLPKFRLKSRTQTKAINIKHVLSHTTGMPYHAYTSSIEAGMRIDKVMSKFRKQKLIGEPGEVYAYQNAVYGMLDPLAEKITGAKFDKVIKGYLFDPLNMEQASATYQAITDNKNVALPHKRLNDSLFRVDKITKKYYNAIPAGGLNASIEDMAKYIQLLLGNRPDLISDEILDEIFQPFVDMGSNRRYRRWPEVIDAHYGMGWRILQRQQDTVVHHSGYVNRYRSEIALNRKEKIAICILSNAPTRFPDMCLPFFFDSYISYKPSIHFWEEEQKQQQEQEVSYGK